jgi:hypothetical protein
VDEDVSGRGWPLRREAIAIANRSCARPRVLLDFDRQRYRTSRKGEGRGLRVKQNESPQGCARWGPVRGAQGEGDATRGPCAMREMVWCCVLAGPASLGLCLATQPRRAWRGVGDLPLHLAEN